MILLNINLLYLYIEFQFKISIKLCYAHNNDLKINIQHNLTNVLNKRLSQETGILNLENFAKDTGM